MANEFEITIDASALAEKINDALATSVVSKVLHEVMLTRTIDKQRMEREFDTAVAQVCKEIFVARLRDDPKFKTMLLAAVTERVSDVLIDKLLKAVEQKIY